MGSLLKEYTVEELEAMRKKAIADRWKEIKELPAVYMTERELNDLRTYSCSLPTGTTIGKQWKKDGMYHYSNTPSVWILCEYYDIGDPKKVGISYHQIRLKGQRIKSI